MQQLSIIIPFFNEKTRLPETLASVLTYTTKHLPDTEIVLVDDGSTDNSIQAIETFLKDARVRLISHECNQGKGAAVHTGVLAARGDLILFSDADLATPIKEVRKLMRVQQEQKCDIAIASRALPESRILTPQPLHRILVGKIGNLIIRAFTGMKFKDTQCGFKLFTSASAKDVFKEQRFPRWSFDIEVLYHAKQFGYSVCEVPVEWRDVAGSKVRPIKDPVQVLVDVVRLRFPKLFSNK